MKTPYRLNLASLPMAMSLGVKHLLNPQQMWADVRQRAVGVQAQVVDFALWWIVLAAGVGLLVRMGWVSWVGWMTPGTYMGPWLAVMVAVQALVMVVAGLASVLGLAWAARSFAQTAGAPAPQWDDALTLVAYSMTPVWVGAALQALPMLGGVALLAGAAYAGYCLWLGLDHVLEVPQDKRVGFMWSMGAAALGAWVAYAVLGWLLLPALAVLWVVLKQRAAEQGLTGAAGAEPAGPDAADAEPAAEPAAQAPAASPVPAASEPSAPLAPQEPKGANAEKIAALDKKIAAAMTKGDMAEVTRLMQEQQALRM
jgi:Yip1 domain